MAEPNEGEYNKIAQLFLNSYNKNNDTDYELDEVDSENKHEWDFLCKNARSRELKVQYTEAIPTYKDELPEFVKFIGGDSKEIGAIHLVHNPDRFLYTLGKKSEKPGVNNDVILLIDFMGFSYDESEISDMKKKGERYSNVFQEVWIMHIGKEKCHKIFSN